MSSLYYKFDNVVTPKVCKEIIDSAGGTFATATIGDDVNRNASREDSKTRKTNIHWSTESKFFKIVQILMAEANNHGGWNLEYSAFESLQIGQYPIGGHYNWHVDGLGLEGIDAPDNEFHHGKTRKLSFVLWLNDDFEGGEFEFHKTHIKDNVIRPSIGTVVIFPSWTMHRVKPVKEGTRYSMVTWALGQLVR
tara:strand:+ start:397 stop:975 length:579 start_codon:yes stop_codon:yes gene_type:complete